LREPHITMPKTTGRSIGILADREFTGSPQRVRPVAD